MRPLAVLVCSCLILASSSQADAQEEIGQLCIERAESGNERCEGTLTHSFAAAGAGELRMFSWSKADGSEVAVGYIPADQDRLDLTTWRRVPIQLTSSSRELTPVTLRVDYDQNPGHAVVIPSERVRRLHTLLLPSQKAQLTLKAEHHLAWTRIVEVSDEVIGPVLLKLAPAVTGSVTAGDSAVLGARIAADDVQTETDALGRFRMEFRERWPDFIRISAAGYADKLLPLPTLQNDADLGVIVLNRGGAIRARVGDAKVDSAKLLLRRGDKLINVRSSEPVDGVVELTEVAPGPYVLMLTGAQPLQRFASELTVDEASVTDTTLSLKPRQLVVSVTADDRPVAARVEVMPAGGEWSAALQTDESGVFRSEVWQEGEFHVFTGRDGSDSVMTRETVSSTAKKEVNWSIALPFKRIEGRVTDDADMPLADVRVTLESLAADGASKRSVQTRDDGSFEFAAVAAGRQNVTGSLEGYLKASTSFDLTEHERTRTVTLQLSRAVVQMVNVVDSTGRPIPRAVLIDESGTTQRVADDAGAVALDMRQGSGGTFYVLPPHGSFATVQILPSRQSQSDPIRVVVPPGIAQLRIVAHTRKGAPVPGVFIALRHNGKLLPLSVQFAMLDRHGVPVQTGPDGNAVLAALPAGLYEVWPYFTRGEIPRIFNGLVEPGARLTVTPGANVISFTFEDPNSD